MTRAYMSCSPTKIDPVATAPGADKTRPRLYATFRYACCVFVCLFFHPLASASAQTQPDDKQPTGIFQLWVKPKVNGKQKVLGRKRFYLIKGGLEENKALVERIKQLSIVTRDCYYANAKASDAFINWLKTEDCESVYCRSIEEQFITGPKAVPEFHTAYEQSLKEYKKPELARQWLTTNLTSEIRNGFYRQKQIVLKALISAAEAASSAAVASVMTDSRGIAFFTDLLPGPYLVTNLMPTEIEDKSILWMCQVQVGLVNKPLLLTNANIKNPKVTCDVKESPLPVCNTPKQTASSR